MNGRRETPNWQLKDGGRVSDDDVRGADSQNNEKQMEAAFAMTKIGEGELIRLDNGDKNTVWLTTLDKVQLPKKAKIATKALKKTKRR